MSLPHDCAWTESVLTGEAPEPSVGLDQFEAGVRACPSCAALADALSDIDDLAANLPELLVPSTLSSQTLHLALEAMNADQRPVHQTRRRGPLLVLAGGLSLAAAALLAVIPQGPAPAPPERLVARGNTVALPSVSLKVAVDEGNGLTRHRRDQSYPAGTRLQFRVGLDQPADVALLRVDASSSQVVVRTSLDGGDHDLELEGSPLAWEVEPGESDARFVIVAAPQGGLSTDALSVLPGQANTTPRTTICATVSHLACDERLLQVSQ